MMRAVERALSIFDAFDMDNPTLTLQGIGTRIGLSKATTHRLVNSLNECGYLVRVGNHRYALSMKFLRLAGLVRSTLTIRDIARPVMIEVAEATGETIVLNTVSGNERICIEVIETPAALMHIVKPGEHVSLLHGATGKILLAYMDEAQVEKILDQSKEGKAMNRKQLFTQLRKFRKQGFSHTAAERAVGVTAVSVPLFDIDGHVDNCLTLSGPSVRVDSRVEEFTKIMTKAGATISNMMGARLLPTEK
jgi:DNA-binding IclR family transcriptional regulator